MKKREGKRKKKKELHSEDKMQSDVTEQKKIGVRIICFPVHL